MAKSSAFLYGSLEPLRPGRRPTAPPEVGAYTPEVNWPQPYWFQNYTGWALPPTGSVVYSGTESWIIRYHRLMPDHLEGREESRTGPDEHLLRFQRTPSRLVGVRRIHEDGTVELEDCSQVWVAPFAPWAALDCARRAWDEFEPPHEDPWRNQGARWRYCPDQELLYWTDGADVHRAALRASTVPITF